MPARLILNADDFGLTQGINRAIGELHSAGVITSTTLMASGAAFDEAVEVARTHPALGVGCHIVLTDGAPVSPPGSIPSLIGADGKSFRPSLVDFVQALLLGRIKEEEVALEALAQIERLERAGIQPTHLDTHKHTHLFPSIGRTLLQIAERCGIHAIRNPFEPEWSLVLTTPVVRMGNRWLYRWRAPAPGISRSARPSPIICWVGVHIAAFEACSSFTRITACQVAWPPKVGFITRFRPARFPKLAAR